jgi:hypothetical protein
MFQLDDDGLKGVDLWLGRRRNTKGRSNLLVRPGLKENRIQIFLFNLFN